MDFKAMQKRVYQNKVNKGFNVSDVAEEFCHLNGEVSEAYDAYWRKKDDLGEELADVAIYLMGIAEILGFDLEKEIENKIEKNENREYINVDGVYIRVKG